MTEPSKTEPSNTLRVADLISLSIQSHLTHRAVFLAFPDGDLGLGCVDAQPVLHPQRDGAQNGQQAGERDLACAGQSFSDVEGTQRFSSEPHTRIRL